MGSWVSATRWTMMPLALAKPPGSGVAACAGAAPATTRVRAAAPVAASTLRARLTTTPPWVPTVIIGWWTTASLATHNEAYPGEVTQAGSPLGHGLPRGSGITRRDVIFTVGNWDAGDASGQTTGPDP